MSPLAIAALVLGGWIALSIPLALAMGRTLARTSMAFGDHHSQTDLAFIGARAQATAIPADDSSSEAAPGDDRLAS